MLINRTAARRFFSGFAAIVIASQSLALDRAQHGQYASCRDGDCDNGIGTIIRVDRQKAYTGRWSNGRFVNGVYEVQYPGISRTFPMRMGADGVPLEGTLPFPSGTEKYSTYTGTFGPPPNTFVTEGSPLLALFRKPDSVLKNGLYIDAYRGYVYEGEFQYIPVVEKIKETQFGEVTLARGVYVMLGSRIDETLDEVETGVFATTGTVAPDIPFLLTPASPSYLAKLQETLAATRAGIQAEKAASARASREAWGTFLGVMAGVAVVAIASKATSSGGSSAMGALQSALDGREDPAALARRLQQTPGSPPSRTSNIISTAEYKRLREGGNSAAFSAPAKLAGNTTTPADTKPTGSPANNRLSPERDRPEPAANQSHATGSGGKNTATATSVRDTMPPSQAARPDVDVSQSMNASSANQPNVRKTTETSKREQSITAQGSAGTCWKRTTSLKMAHSDSITDARRECGALGQGWTYKRVAFEGYEQCSPCASNEEFFCKVTQAIHLCENTRN